MTTIEAKPKYQWHLLITLYIVIDIGYLIPTVIFSLKVLKTIDKKELKQRWLFFNIGYLFEVVAFHGLILYTTLFEGIIVLIISLIVLIVVILGGAFMYYGSIKSLK